MRPVWIAIFLALFVTACASNRPDIESKIHTCVYSAMDEAVQERIWVKWDAKENNCSSITPNRGRMLLKQAEVIKNRICAEFFMHSQMHNFGEWQNYDMIITACRHPTKQIWFVQKGDQILDLLILDEILN